MNAARSAINSQPYRAPTYGRSIPAWNRCVVLLVIAVAAYFQTWADLWPFWENKNATYTHGTLVALMALWLVWRARPKLEGVAAAWEPVALLPLFVLSSAWMLGARANLFIVHVVIWPLLAYAMLWAGVGWRVAAKIAFPLSFLYFAIPVWDYLKPPLQAITSTMVGFLTGLAGIPASVDGPYITLPNDRIFIALDCSGAHFLCVALAVGVLAGVIRGDRVRTRILILVLAGLLSMIFNWTRILLIVFAYLHADLKHGLETLGHFTFGWWVFALDLLVFSLALRFVPLSRIEKPVSRIEDSGAARRGTGLKGLALAVAASLALPIAAWAMPRLGLGSSTWISPPSTPSFPNRVTSPDRRWAPEYVGAAWELRTAYFGSEGRAIEVYGAEYHEQSQGKELISTASLLFNTSVFTTLSSATVMVNRDTGPPFEARSVNLIDSSKQQWMALYTYYVDADTTASGRHAQLWIALRSLYSRPTAGVVSVAMPCVPECASVSGELHHALSLVYAAQRPQHPPPGAP